MPLFIGLLAKTISRDDQPNDLVELRHSRQGRVIVVDSVAESLSAHAVPAPTWSSGRRDNAQTERTPGSSTILIATLPLAVLWRSHAFYKLCTLPHTRLSTSLWVTAGGHRISSEQCNSKWTTFPLNGCNSVPVTQCHCSHADADDEEN